MPKRAVLLVNLGSPDSPSVPDVKRYLREFLGDERVIDRPRLRLLRKFLVDGIIIPRRAAASAHAYSTIWTPAGSPLVVTSGRAREKLSARLGAGTPVYLAMRYGRPSIDEVIARLAADGIHEVLIFPQYPHYAMASWETVVVRVCESAAQLAPQLRLHCVKPFYADPDYIDALAAVCRPYLDQPHDHVLFSYHGIPVRHVGIASLKGVNVTFAEAPEAKWDPGRAGGAEIPDSGPKIPNLSYLDHVQQTTAALVQRAGIARHSIAFQSRLVGEPWLSPYTDVELPRLARAGANRMLVLCPAFTTDCLETLEEIQVRARDDFLAAGGTSFQQIPCLNDHPAFIDFLAKRAQRWIMGGQP
ncbi:MAG: Ferrochelatase [Verrucomicrobia bacterium]|nr:Ferrochelatase [Verrucomicrobiota bacterium]